MYFRFYKLHWGAKKSVDQSKAIPSEVPQGHLSARPIPRDPGISPCTNDRQVSWLSGHHSTAPSHFRNGIMRYYSPVHSDEIVQDLHLFPFYPQTPGLRVRGTYHVAYSVLSYCSTSTAKCNSLLRSFFAVTRPNPQKHHHAE